MSSNSILVSSSGSTARMPMSSASCATPVGSAMLRPHRMSFYAGSTAGLSRRHPVLIFIITPTSSVGVFSSLPHTATYGLAFQAKLG